MKIEKLWRPVAVTAVLSALLLVFSSCDPAGGQGADFDDTLYYTKSEVDALIDELEASIETAKQEAIEASEPIDGTADALELAGVNWAGRTPGGFTVPGDEVQRVLVEVVGTNSSAEAKKCYIEFGTDGVGEVIAQFILPNDGGYHQFMGLVTVPGDASAMYGWHSTSHAGAAADLTDVTISIQPKLWLK